MSAAAGTSSRALLAVNEAALAIASNLSLEHVLGQIVESAMQLVNARYGAVGIPSAHKPLERFVHRGMPSDALARIGRMPRGHGLLGEVTKGNVILLDDMASHPASIGFPDGHPPMRGLIGVPIRAANKVVGLLYLADRTDGQGFSEADVEVVEMLASHASIAIQNAQLYERVRELSVVEERARIGMDLHDGVIQSIYAVGLMLESARLQMLEDPDTAGSHIEEAIEGLNGAIGDIRNFILDLRPRRFDGNFEGALDRLVREFQANAGVPVTVEVSKVDMKKVSAELARDLIMSSQEALANVARHAKASRVLISFEMDGDIARLLIEDDGAGFRPETSVNSVGHGLANMRARAESAGGTFTIESAPGDGTRLTTAVTDSAAN